MKMLPFITKRNRDETTTIVIYDAGVAYPVISTSPHYEDIMEGIRNEDIEHVRKFLKLKNAIVDFSQGKVVISGDELYFNGELLHNVLAERIIHFFRQNLPMNAIVAFLDNVMQNPSKDAQNELYMFLEACDLPITDDGHFLAYKVVDSNYKDKRTGTMDNSVGATPKMNREDCDPSRHNTCSRGLHFCSKSYISAFRGHGDHLMVVKVNPRDVTAIPSDYNNAKGRACEYYILEEIENAGEIKPWYSNGNNVPVPSDDEFDEGLDSLEDEELEDEDESAPVAILKPIGGTPKVVANAISDDIRAKVLAALAEPEATLTSVANKFGIHRRSVGRIRDAAKANG